MREILVIGIGAGNPDHITVQAVEALNRAEVFFVVDKGDEKRGLLDLRDEICRRHIRDQSGYRVVPIADPPRDRGAADYEGAVEDWHEKRSMLFENAIADNLGEDGVGAFLVWGDPALYDSTLRVIERILGRGTIQFDYQVIPGIMSVQALTAEHRLPLNRIGEPIHITTGRRIAEAGSLPGGLDSAIVMLDAGFAGATITDPDVYVYWGAYLGTPDEVLMSGRLVDVAGEIARTQEGAPRGARLDHGHLPAAPRRSVPGARRRVEVALAEVVGGQDAADDDHRGSPDAGRANLLGDAGEIGPEDHFVLARGVGDDGDRAVAAVVRQQLVDDRRRCAGRPDAAPASRPTRRGWPDPRRPASGSRRARCGSG